MPVLDSPPKTRSRTAAMQNQLPEEASTSQSTPQVPPTDQPPEAEVEALLENAPVNAQQPAIDVEALEDPRPESTVQISAPASQPQGSPVKSEESDAVVRKMQSLVVHTQKDAPRFNGRTDPIQWLRDFKRVASFNGHSEAQMLATAPFCLTGEALDWYDNEGDRFVSWKTFEEEFSKRFVDHTKISEEARDKLKRLVYEKGTSFTGHLETVLKLCRQIDAKLSEAEIIRKTIQTFARDQAMTLVSKAPKTVAELRDHMSYLDRTIPFVNQREVDGSINAVGRSASSSRSRSSERYGSGDRYRSPAHQSFDQRSSVPDRSFGQHTARPAPKYAPVVVVQPGQFLDTEGPFFSGNRRTPDGQPICNWCNRGGHIIKHCLSHRNGYPAVKPTAQAQNTPAPPHSGN